MTTPAIYGALYGAAYGAQFPNGATLATRVELNLGGVWTDITNYALQRDGSSPPISIQRGRPDETSTANPSQAQFQLKNQDGRFTTRKPDGPYYPLLNRNTPVRISVPDTGTSLRMEDDSISFSSTTNTPPHMPTGDQDIRLDLKLSDYTACVLASWWAPAGERAWLIILNDDGTLTFETSSDGTLGTTNTWRSSQPIPLGATCLRITYNSTGHAVTYYTAATGSILLGPWTQLGSVVAGTGSSYGIFNSTTVFSVGYNSTANTDFGYVGPNGRVYDALLLAGIGGQPIARGGFSQLAAGTTTWTDAQNNPWHLGSTAVIDGQSYRYHGEMSSLPGNTDPSGHDVYVALTSGGLLRRLGQGNAPLPTAMRRWVESLAGLRAYWPMEEGSAGDQFSSGLVPTIQGGSGFPLLVTEGSPSFGADNTFVASAALPQTNNCQMFGKVAAYNDTGTLVVRFLCNPGSSIAGYTTILRIDTGGTKQSLYVNFQPGVGWQLTGSGFGSLLTSFANVTGPVMVSVELTSSGGTVTPNMRIMDTSGNVTTPTPVPYTGTTGAVRSFFYNPFNDLGATNNAANTVIGHIALETTLTTLTGTPQSVIQAWSGEHAADRFSRLCAENGIQSRIYGWAAVTEPMGSQAPGTLVSLLQECEQADLGMITEPRESLSLGYRTLASMVNQSPAVTLDYSQSHLGQLGQAGEWQPTDDDLFTRNDVTVSRSGATGAGGSAVAVLNDGSPMSISPPPAGVGDYATTLSANVQHDNALPNLAGWLMHQGTTDQERYPLIPLNLARSELLPMFSTLIAWDLGDMIQVNNPPSWQPPGEIEQLMFGVQELLGGFWYLMGPLCVPSEPYEVFALDTDPYDRLDTDGTTLNAPVSATQPWLQVNVTNATSPLWTQSGSDVPFDINVDGEQMTVTGIGPLANWLSGTDAGFEDGTIGHWNTTANCGLAAVNSQKNTGAWSLKLTSSAAGDMSAQAYSAARVLSLGLPCAPGDTVQGSAFFKAGSTGRSTKAGVAFYGLAGLISTVFGSTFSDVTTGWTQATFSGVVAPAGTIAATPVVDVLATGAGGEQHFVDDVVIINVATMGGPGQIFKVTRSVNGIVKSHALGAAVSLFEPMALAIL